MGEMPPKAAMTLVTSNLIASSEFGFRVLRRIWSLWLDCIRNPWRPNASQRSRVKLLILKSEEWFSEYSGGPHRASVIRTTCANFDDDAAAGVGCNEQPRREGPPGLR
jgi:hypothetical protein